MAVNPRMPLTGRGIAYLFLIVAGALAAAFVVIRASGILEAHLQYDIAISLIVLFIGIFFCRDSILIELGRRTVGSVILASLVFFVLYLIDIL
jgi:hypothetical protein